MRTRARLSSRLTHHSFAAASAAASAAMSPRVAGATLRQRFGRSPAYPFEIVGGVAVPVLDHAAIVADEDARGERQRVLHRSAFRTPFARREEAIGIQEASRL